MGNSCETRPATSKIGMIELKSSSGVFLFWGDELLVYSYDYFKYRQSRQSVIQNGGESLDYL